MYRRANAYASSKADNLRGKIIKIVNESIGGDG